MDQFLIYNSLGYQHLRQRMIEAAYGKRFQELGECAQVQLVQRMVLYYNSYSR